MNFSELKVNPLILMGIEKMGFEEMTDIQSKVIPVALDGVDIIGQAPTGTGKTVAFSIPVLNTIDANFNKVQAIIIAPTRELAVQITKEVNKVAFLMEGVKAVAVYGGEPIEKQITALKKKPQIIVATPGRLMDHMRRATVRLDNVKTVVLDEADEMLNMGFRDDINAILEETKTDHQTLLFSATFSKEIEEIARQFMNDAKKISVQEKSLTVSFIDQYYIDVYQKDKVEVISRIIDINEYKLSMVFCNTKKDVDEVTSDLLTRGFLTEALHGDMKQMQRDRVMQRFREGTINVLVASDVAARGLDIDDVEIVFNYDLPQDEEYYVHRIGRTGRASKTGISVSLVSRSDKSMLRQIVKYCKADIKKMEVPSLDKVIKVRTKRILERALLASYEESKYDNVITKQLSKIEEESKDRLIKGLTNLLINAGEKNSEIEEVKEEIISRKTRYNHGDVRFFISLGRRDGIKVYNLTDMLVAKTGLTNADINAVELHEDYSFFEVPLASANEVCALNGVLKHKGRTLYVEVAKEKKNSAKMKKSTPLKKNKNGYFEVNAKDLNLNKNNRKSNSGNKNSKNKKKGNK